MGNLEKYGVCALLFVIVTVLAISIWGPRPARPAGSSPAPKSASSPEVARRVSPPMAKEPDAGPRGARPLDARRSLVDEFTETGDLFSRPPVPVPGVATAGASAAKEEAPAASAAGEAKGTRPSTPQARVYVVRKGDVLETIAQKELGAASKWREIVQWNEGIDPLKLQEGQPLVLPPGDLSLPLVALRTESPAPAIRTAVASTSEAGSRHTIAKDETLYKIAEQYLRNGSRWREIYEANRATIDDPDRLRVGMVIRIPGR